MILKKTGAINYNYKYLNFPIRFFKFYRDCDLNLCRCSNTGLYSMRDFASLHFLIHHTFVHTTLFRGIKFNYHNGALNLVETLSKYVYLGTPVQLSLEQTAARRAMVHL